MALTKGQFLLYETVAKLQAALIKNDKRIELTTGERYLTAAVNAGGLLLASGNYANPIGGAKESDQPTNISPTSGATSVSLPATLTASAYSGTDVHIHSIWSVYSDAGGATEVYNSGASDDLTSHVIPVAAGLLDETQYWFGVQYVGVASISTRSALTSFTTDVAFSSLFATTLIAGTGAPLDVVTSIDSVANESLLWIKNRDATDSHNLVDTVRGAILNLASDTTSAEVSDSRVTSFNADGFSLSSDIVVNTSGENYVAGQLVEKQGLFDIAPFTGDGIAGRTVALNLDDGGTAEFGMSIVKCTSDGGTNWAVRHRSLAPSDGIQLNQTSAASTQTTTWNSTAGTTTELTLGTSINVNWNTKEFISYNFAHNPAKGIFCGSYVGTGAAGNKQTTTFPVGWVMPKASSTTGDWPILDIKRATSSDLNKTLLANTTAAETSASVITSLSDGFEFSGSASNALGVTYIYMALADPAQF
jgi:hypothetical protein